MSWSRYQAVDSLRIEISARPRLYCPVCDRMPDHACDGDPCPDHEDVLLVLETDDQARERYEEECYEAASHYSLMAEACRQP